MVSSLDSARVLYLAGRIREARLVRGVELLRVRRGRSKLTAVHVSASGAASGDRCCWPQRQIRWAGAPA